MSTLTPRPWVARRSRRVAGGVVRSLLLLVVLVVVACAGSGPDPSSLTAAPEPTRPAAAPEPTRIAFDLPEFDPAATRRVLRRDPYSGNEVYQAQFAGADSFAVVALVKAGPGYVLEPRDLGGHIGHMLPETAVAWGGRGSVRVADRRTAYRWFELPELALRCFAFDERWRPAHVSAASNGDPRFMRQAFGFYCRAADLTLDEADVRRLIPMIGFTGDV